MPNKPFTSSSRTLTSVSGTSGFTILEVLTVMLLISLLAAMTYPMMGWVQNRQRLVRAKADIDTLGLALKRYHLTNGTYPRFDPGSSDLSSFDNIARKKSYRDEKRSSEALFLALTGWNDANCERITGKSYDQRARYIELDEITLWSDEGKRFVENAMDSLGSSSPQRPQGLYIADPWRQPYLYKYPILTNSSPSGNLPKYIRREDFILLSKGQDESLDSKNNTNYGPNSWLANQDAGIDISEPGEGYNLDNISLIQNPAE